MSVINLNYELTVDGEEFKMFKSCSVSTSLSALSSFTLNVGNPEGSRNKLFQFNSEIEFKAAWGDDPLQTIIRGFIKGNNNSIGVERGISLSGIDFGDYMLRKKPWNVDYDPLIFNNEKVSTILARLIGLTPQIKLQLTKIPNEPRLDWETDPTSNYVIDEFKKVAEYGGYEWFIIGDRLICRNPKTISSGSVTQNLIIGPETGTLPSLPNALLYGASNNQDAGSIRNFYKVDGAIIGNQQLSAIGRDVSSIQQYKGTFEGYYSDPQLTSIQSCYVVAKRLAEINGQPRTSIGVTHKGSTSYRVGDIVGVSDEYGGFDNLTNPYLRVASMNHNFGTSWSTSCQLGTQRRKLSDII